MDNIYLDTYYFFVPSRILWTHFNRMMGENDQSAWYPETEYSVPLMYPPEGGWQPGTIADYLGIPVNVGPSEGKLKYPSALPFRAVAMIADQWFRDENVSDHLNIHLDDANQTGSNGSNYITNVELGGKPFPVAKYHDYFTSCLPSPLKHNKNISIGGNFFNQNSITNSAIPVYAANSHGITYSAMTLRQPSAGSPIRTVAAASSSNPTVYATATPSETVVPLTPDNLWADISGTISDTAAITINDLRVAFQLQKYYEKNARGGTRLRELIKEHFGITTEDARMQIPEYLGGHRIPLSIHQVANQSAGESEFLGDLGALSNTSDVHEDFVKSFTEWGYVIGVCCCRYDHSYPQGLEKFWTRSGKLDYYWPVFANVGEQPVYKQEIMWTSEQTGYEVFGYQEAYAEYRFKPNRVSSEMRPGVSNSLATWHLADYYDTVPSLNHSWISEDKSNVDRVLSVTSSVSNQIFADFYVKNIATRPMPMFSIPGLIDHH